MRFSCEYCGQEKLKTGNFISKEANCGVGNNLSLYDTGEWLLKAA